MIGGAIDGLADQRHRLRVVTGLVGDDAEHMQGFHVVGVIGEQIRIDAFRFGEPPALLQRARPVEGTGLGSVVGHRNSRSRKRESAAP